MLLSLDMNLWAVLVAAVATVILGSIWYSPPVFGTAWMKLAGVKEKDMKKEGMWKRYLVLFVGQIVMSFILANLANAVPVVSAAEGALLGIMVWLGFVATISMGSVLWENKPIKLYCLNNTYNIIQFALMGAILGGMQ